MTYAELAHAKCNHGVRIWDSEPVAHARVKRESPELVLTWEEAFGNVCGLCVGHKRIVEGSIEL